MRTRMLLAGLGLAMAPLAAHAQRIEASRFAVTPVRADTHDVTLRKPASRARVFWVRTLVSALTATAGAFAGYAAGHYYTPVNQRSDLAPSGQELVGLGIGFLAGAALGPVLKGYDSPCSGEERFLRGTLGAVVGFLPGVLIGPLGPGMGAAALQGRC